MMRMRMANNMALFALFAISIIINLINSKTNNKNRAISIKSTL
jgi:hypothetical protein